MNKSAALRALLYSGDLLAVDLGTFSVKVLSLKAKERSLTVLGSAQREIWRELSAAKSEEERNEVYARALRELAAAPGFTPRNASASLSGNEVMLRFLALPPGFDPEAGLPAEARALIPFDEAEAVVLNNILGGAKASAEMMLTVARKNAVQGGMSILLKAGLRPAVIINDALALANAYEFFEARRTSETVVLVNSGATSTSVCVVENGEPKAARVLNIAGNSFTRAVKREFSVELEEAEALKIAHGLAVPAGKTADEGRIAARVARALMPAAKDLSGEIQRTIDVFLARRPADYPPIRRIVLAGGSAELKGLSERLATDAGLAVDVFRPMINVTADGGGLGIAPLAPALGVACGLGLSNTLVRRTHRGRVNLVPRRARRAAIIRDVSPGFWRLIAGPALAALTLCAYAVCAVRIFHNEAVVEKNLEAAAKTRLELQRRFAKKAPVVVVKRAESNPFAFLSKLTISGVVGDSRNALVMLNGRGSAYVARGGKLFDENEEAVRGVASEMGADSLTLTAGGRTYRVALPK